MKILMLNPLYLPHQGGTEKVIREVSTRLVKKGYEVAIATAQLPGTPREEMMDGVRVFRSKAWVLEKMPALLPPPVPVSLTMERDIKRLAPHYDVVHLHNRFFYGFLDLNGLKERSGAKIALTLYNARPKGINFQTDLVGGLYDETLGRRMMKHSDRIAGVSQNTLDITVPRKYLDKCQVVYNGVDVKLFNPRVSGEEVRHFLGFDGCFVVMTNVRMVPQKGVKYLLRAMAILRKHLPKSKLVVFGRGPIEDELKKEAAKLGLGHDVLFFTHRLPDAGLARLSAACDVFVLPSVWEPFGMVLAEAMACGKPVIGAAAGGIPEVVSPDTGFLVPPRDPVSLARKLYQLSQDEKLRKKFGTAGRKRVEKLFTWDETAKGYMDFYQKLEQL